MSTRYRRGMTSRFLDGLPLAPEWLHVKTPGATITLNGGTVTDIAGGLRITVPGGSASPDDPTQGTIIRIPLYYWDGTRARYGDAAPPRLRIREIGTTPGLSSDTRVMFGMDAEGNALASRCFGVGAHYSAANRIESVILRGTGAFAHYDNAAPTGNLRGIRMGGDWVDYNNGIYGQNVGAYATDADGTWRVYTESSRVAWPSRPLTDDPIDLWLAVYRSAATAGAETIDIAAEYVATPIP